MFKKKEEWCEFFTKKFDDIRAIINGYYTRLDRYQSNVNTAFDNIAVLSNTLAQVINDKYENDNNQFEAVILIPYRGKPMVFKNGKRIDSERMTGFDVYWNYDTRTEINIKSE